MLRTLLISTAFLAASGSALAHGEVTGRVITVEPRFSVSFGTGYHDGFRVLYESGGSRYWTYTPHHPGHVIVLPPPRHVVRHVHHHHNDRGWRDGPPRRDHGWRDERDRHHDHRGDRGHPRGHRY